MRTALLKLPAVLALLALGGCVSTNYVLLGGTGTYPAVAPNEVRIYLTEADIKAPHEKIALITVKGSSSLNDETALIRAMRKRAATLGANGLVLGDIREPGVVERVAGVIFDHDPQRTGRAVAVRIQSTPESR